MESYIPTKIDLTPRRFHGYATILFILGTLFPPLAVAARFGVGSDFWLNLLLTICGYIPGHVHNFYIQNIRNNKNHARTPKWVQKYGLVDISAIKRKERKSQWANRYSDRLPSSTLEGQALEEGQEGSSSVDVDLSTEGHRNRERNVSNGNFWRPEDENYYATERTSAASTGRWHYPANFDDAAAPAPVDKNDSKRRKKEKKDRWARTQDAHSLADEESKKHKRMKKKKKNTVSESLASTESGSHYPEDASGGRYGEGPRQRNVGQHGNLESMSNTNGDEYIFSHQV